MSYSLKYYALAAFLLLSCNSNKKFETSPEVKTQVEKKLGKKPNNLAYQNELIAEITLNNTTVRSKGVSDILSFRSFHFWDGDTLKIAGGFGVASGYGFIIRIIHEQATVWHLIFSEQDSIYSLTEKGPWVSRLEVPCESWDLRLYKIPETQSDDPIYGVLTFKSTIYYEKGRNKTDSRSVDMDITFFSRKTH